jgi:hypothetical protein
MFVVILLEVLVGCDIAQGSPQERLAYYSDYFSFIGLDNRGRVAFALDTNRGQDGTEFQAEHFVVLHDEIKGWHKLDGNGPYPNPAGSHEEIPDSVHFRFTGLPGMGMVIESPANRLVFKTQPIPMVIDRRFLKDRYRMGWGKLSNSPKSGFKTPSKAVQWLGCPAGRDPASITNGL